MDSLVELEGKIDENINLIIETVKEDKKFGGEAMDDEHLAAMKEAVLDCILLQKKVHNFQQAVKHVQQETTATENLEDALMEHFEALNADIDDDLTGHQSYKKLLAQFEVGSPVSKDAESTENTDEDAENSMVMTREINIPLDPITKQYLVDPVVNKICKHMYERSSVMQHIAERKKHARCPVGGCGNTALLHAGILGEDAEMKKLIERKKRGDASFFN